MTLLNMYEIIKRQFPEMAEKEIVRRISWKEREFANKTRCLFDTYSVTPDNTSFSDTIVIPHTNCQAIRHIRYYDTTGVQISGYDADLSWYIMDRDIHFRTWNGALFTAWPANVATIEIVYTYLPSELTLVTNELQVEEAFHEGILNGTFEQLWAERGDMQKAVYFNARFKDAVLQGKRYANSDGDDSIGPLVPSGFTL